VNTTLSGACAAMMATVIARVFTAYFDIALTVNGVLGGLVSVTGSCAFIEPWMAIVIGLIAAWVYYGAHLLLLRFGIDDPLDAAAVHGACGVWGLLAAGIFCTDSNVRYAGYPNTNTACKSGEQFGVQVRRGSSRGQVQRWCSGGGSLSTVSASRSGSGSGLPCNLCVGR
jgi:Amt family ammonium transporter